MPKVEKSNKARDRLAGRKERQALGVVTVFAFLFLFLFFVSFFHRFQFQRICRHDLKVGAALRAGNDFASGTMRSSTSDTGTWA